MSALSTVPDGLSRRQRIAAAFDGFAEKLRETFKRDPQPCLVGVDRFDLDRLGPVGKSLKGLIETADFRKNIERLGPEDVYVMSLGGSSEIAGVSTSLSGSIQVSHLGP